MNHANVQRASFIFDTSRVPWLKRFLLKMLDVLAWGAWLLLWLPLLTGLVALLDGQSQGLNPVLTGFAKAVGIGAAFLGVMWLLFMAWTVVRRVNMLSIRQSISHTKHILHVDHLAKTFLLQKDVLQDWQQTQIMLAHHSEDTGWLQHIDELPMISGRAFDSADYAIIIKPH
jgi:poly-beta-1,6-N-acetyl-D-glucosamine biosynthesis protein PgaD